MRVEESLLSRVRIVYRIVCKSEQSQGVSAKTGRDSAVSRDTSGQGDLNPPMMQPMPQNPPPDTPLEPHAAHGGEPDPNGQGRLESLMRPESMIAQSDAANSDKASI